MDSVKPVSMQISIGSDHAGFELKERVKRFLEERSIPFEDYGTDSAESVDYPDIAVKVARAISATTDRKGILVCGTGVGMAIVANKIEGIRATLCTSTELAKLSRRHNDANILTLGARTTDADLAVDIVRTFLNTQSDDAARHRRRIQKIHDLTGK
jgi:ribose 5-phosphate isomerase B